MRKDPEPFDRETFFAGMWKSFIIIPLVLFGLCFIGACFQYLTNVSDFSAPEPPAVLGQQGFLITESTGCPKLKDLQELDESTAHSTKVNDEIGVRDAITDAQNDGCRFIQVGQSGLVINMIGYYSGWTEVRLDDDETTYWIDNRAIGTLSAPNWDLRRLFWDRKIFRNL